MEWKLKIGKTEVSLSVKRKAPQSSSRELLRWYLTEVLDAMGRTNAEEEVDRLVARTSEP